jgi:hypothetical protein
VYRWKPVLLAAVIAGLVLEAPAPAQAPESDKIVNAVYRLSGQLMGTYTEKRTLDVDGNTVTTIDSDMVFNRMGSKLELKSKSSYVESARGALLRVDSVSSSSQQATTTHATVHDKTLRITTEAGGHTYERSLAISTHLLGPEAVRQLAVSHLGAAGDTVSYDTFSAELGGIVTVTDKAITFNDLPAGQKTAGTKIEQTMTGLPTPGVLWADNTGWLLRQTTPSPFGEIEVLRTDSSAVQGTPVEGATLPEETFNRSIVNANIRLPQERLVEKIKLKIIARRPGLVWPDFSADNQTVLEKKPDYVILEVRRPAPHGEGGRPVAMTAALHPYLEPNALLQSDDAGVREVEGSVVHNDDSAWYAARALQKWTAENMHFDLGIAIVPASEVAKNHSGTCFGYSMLLGSLARAAGIPSRVRVGLVYAGGIWGGHAWVELLIGDQWIPIDGALYAPGAADAARFSVFTGSLESGTVGTLGGLGQVLGNVDIKILEYTVDGRNAVVDVNAKPYSIDGNTYRNPWVGLTVAAPSGFHFTGFDLAWPQTTVVAMGGPGGQRVEIHNESASLPTSASDRDKLLQREGISGPVRSRRIGRQIVAFAESQQTAGMILEEGGSVWVVKATGAHARVLLDQVASSMRLRTGF